MEVGIIIIIIQWNKNGIIGIESRPFIFEKYIHTEQIWKKELDISMKWSIICSNKEETRYKYDDYR